MANFNKTALLDAKQLKRSPSERELPFKSTAEIHSLEGTAGQPRAVSAIEFGLHVKSFGYNLYVAGVHGSGRESTVREYVEKHARFVATPNDWVYVHNFDNPDFPKALRLPPGMGCSFKSDMEDFVRSAQRLIPKAFESEDYERRKREAVNLLNQKRGAYLDEVQNFAKDNNFTIELTPGGFITIPILKGEQLSTEAFENLDEPIQEEYKRRNKEVQAKITSTLRDIRQLEKDVQEQMKQLDRDVAQFTAGPLLDELREKYADLPDMVVYLDRIQADILQHLNQFRPSEEQQTPLGPFGMMPNMKQEDHAARYKANVLIDHKNMDGAPVVVERNPTYYNLLGRVNYRPSMGSLVTDYQQIKSGALHRANGGFLILHVLDVLKNPFAWDSLKRALQSGEIHIESMGEQFTMLPTASLRPEPIPLNVKVILIGPPQIYQLLHKMDEDFDGLFKVKADFSPDMDWTDENVRNYAAFISRCVKDHSLRHFDRSGIARIVEYGSRLMEHQNKLSAKMVEIADIATEASFWAGKNGRDRVTEQDVSEAIQQKEYHSNLYEEKIHELIVDKTILIDTEGAKTGQVNGMAIIGIGDYYFGKPARITATVGLGRGKLTSIEREVDLSGPIHTKGVLTLSGYLAEKYSQSIPLALNATITFEQSYDEVEGDSASSTELYALLSALSNVPLKQGIAVTGSVNQRGEIQAVGGVTRKIEGFFDVCKHRGLNGEQGVIIPKANVSSLMLKDDVIRAVEHGLFHVWAVSTIDEGIELLTGIPSGRMGADKKYEEGTIHYRVEERLKSFFETSKALAQNDNQESQKKAA